MADKKQSKLQQLLGIGDKLVDGMELAIEHVRIETKEPDEGGYDLLVLRDANTNKRYHTFSAKIIKQMTAAADELGGFDALNKSLTSEPLACTVKSTETKNGYNVLFLE